MTVGRLVKLAALWVTALLFSTQQSLCFSHHFERLLYRQLLDGYEALARPVENYSSPVKVKMGLLLQQLVDVDEKNQIVETNIWQQLVSAMAANVIRDGATETECVLAMERLSPEMGSSAARRRNGSPLSSWEDLETRCVAV